jgi:hypothetical protein
MEILGIPILHFLLIVGGSLGWGLICIVGCSWLANQSHEDAKRNTHHVLKQQHLEYYLRTGDKKQIDIIERLKD